jgi:mono/diheme cytochrome c family protein
VFRYRTIVAMGVGVFAAACIAATALSEEKSAEAEGQVPKGDPKQGETFYNRYCRGCHGEEGKGDGLVFMPHVDNLTRRGYIETLPDSYLLLAITKGGPGIGKSTYMPAWEGTLTKQQMYDIIAYIRSLPLH